VTPPPKQSKATPNAPDAVPTSVPSVAVLILSPLELHGQAINARESELLEGTSTRITADQEIREEAPRVDFEHLTAADDERPLKRPQRTDQEIAKDTLKAIVLGERCTLHDTPDCSVCHTTELHLQYKDEVKAHYDKYCVVVTKITPTSSTRSPADMPIVLLDKAAQEKKRQQAAADTQAQDHSKAKQRAEAALRKL
jgi:hypothetical protein